MKMKRSRLLKTSFVKLFGGELPRLQQFVAGVPVDLALIDDAQDHQAHDPQLDELNGLAGRSAQEHCFAVA